MKIMILALVLSIFSFSIFADEYSVDTSHSVTSFKVKHMGVAYTHGRFNEFKGDFSFDKNDDSKNSIKILIKASSIDSNDPKRDEHLRGEDFFHAKKYKTLSFKSTSFKKQKGSSDTYDVTGTLEIRGKEKEITVAVKYIGEGNDPWGNYRCGFETQFTVNRSDFGMNYMPDGISDEVTITIGIEGTKNK